MNAVIYARFSSSAQREASIEQQINVCLAFAEREGYNVIQTYSDRALTGRTDRRPQFLQMIKDAKKGHFCVIIVYALDRFSRDKYDSARYKHELRQNGVRVVSATEPISDNPSGILIESVFEGLAQYYSAELAQKIRRGYEDNAKNAWRPDLCRSDSGAPLMAIMRSCRRRLKLSRRFSAVSDPARPMPISVGI